MASVANDEVPETVAVVVQEGGHGGGACLYHLVLKQAVAHGYEVGEEVGAGVFVPLDAALVFDLGGCIGG